MRISGKTLMGGTALLAGATLMALVGNARSLVIDMPRSPRFNTFQMLDPSVAPPAGAASVRQAASLRGSSLAALPDGALVLDPDSGTLVRTDRAANVVARLPIAPAAAQVVLDRVARRAYVTDRANDRVVVVNVSTGLKPVTTYRTSAEPYGVALTPDRKTLLVTTIADRQLIGFDTATGKRRWTANIGPEPRAVAVSPDGKRAVVTFLNTGAVARLSLRGDAAPQIRYRSLNRRRAANPRGFRIVPANKNPDVGRGFARAAFTATYVGPDMVAIAHQTSTPIMTEPQQENRGTYGGGGSFALPVEHHLSFLAEPRAEAISPRRAQARIGVHQPRAIYYDGKRDLLLVAGYGTDVLIALAGASRPSIRHVWSASLSATDGCGATGIDVADDGRVLVHCSLSRTVAIVKAPTLAKQRFAKAQMSSALTTTRLSVAALRGRKLFRMGSNAALSSLGAMACSSCHPEVRTDGLSWRIGGKALQTPILGARAVGTHPFKWDGGDKDIQTSLRNTVTRLGGRGISSQQASDIFAFLQSVPRPRTPTVKNPRAVARGKRLFHSKQVGCASCHNGPKLTNRKKYDIASNMPDGVDTPSLIGLSQSAPYYHDGSAATLRAVLLENGTVHGMGRVSKLRQKQIDDLIAYLETL